MSAWSEFVTPENIAAGFAVIGAGGLSLIGILRGRAKPSGNIEVAGALIDSSQARNVVAALDRNTDAAKRCAHELEENSRELRRLTDETIRSGGHTVPPFGR